ncbi:MAG: CDP-glucose 4,6-dehydratase [Bacteroidetes bacterium]|nr:MAG: CDP-glucose 4,6-dehydratase [Bacteroidota bacterium]RLD84610.1 MAG: CDP-glucose 4,6-dehydratase [Bacteroidota bacterium]
MENLVEEKLFKGIYFGKKVLVTGHTGFKGSWLSLWLHLMGAEVYGISLEPTTDPNHISLLEFPHKSYIQDISDKNKLGEIMQEIEPEIIFHLAAQPLVRLSYENPVETYQTNVMGTINVLDEARKIYNLKAIVIVTSDKCYDNKEWIWGYRENEAFGGKDPYSSSKGCAEIITAAYRHSFFNPEKFGIDHNVLIASVRAGNVIGGGDWALDRIVTDMIKSTAEEDIFFIRSPKATRPWQHVLEPLSGYLLVGLNLLEGNMHAAEGWNFGPESESNLSVLELVEESKKHWKKIKYTIDHGNHPHEANFLMLDSSKAKKLLGWRPVWSFNRTVRNTVDWYMNYYEQNKILTYEQLNSYIGEARKKEIVWTQP